MAEILIPVRRYRIRTDPDVPCVEENFGYEKRELKILLDEAGLILVDTWNMHIVGSWLKRATKIMEKKIAPLLQAARKARMTVVHAPSPPVARKYPQWVRYAGDEDLSQRIKPAADWPPPEFMKREGKYAEFLRWKEPLEKVWREKYKDMRIADSVKPLPSDFVVATGTQLQRLLRSRKILHLFYAGFATAVCLQFRGYGMRAMSRRGYNLILLRDCTNTVESDDTLKKELTKEINIREIEIRLAFSTTSEQFIKALQRAK